MDTFVFQGAHCASKTAAITFSHRTNLPRGIFFATLLPNHFNCAPTAHKSDQAKAHFTRIWSCIYLPLAPAWRAYNGSTVEAKTSPTPKFQIFRWPTFLHRPPHNLSPAPVQTRVPLPVPLALFMCGFWLDSGNSPWGENGGKSPSEISEGGEVLDNRRERRGNLAGRQERRSSWEGAFC